MNKSLGFLAGMCIFSFVFFMFSMMVTEGRPVARAEMGGIGILVTLLMVHFVPELDGKRETNYQKCVFGLEIIIFIFWFVILMAMIGMIQVSLEELGYISGNVCIECGP